MVIRRCAWHGQYVGHRGGYRVDSWRGGLSVSYTDGICGHCAALIRAAPASESRASRAPGLAILFPQRAALLGAALGIVAVLGLPGSFLDETLWQPATVIMIPARMVEAGRVTARPAPARRVVAARLRPAHPAVARVRPGTRGVLDPLVAWAGTTEVPPAAEAPAPEPPLRDNPATLPPLAESWVASVSGATTRLPWRQREIALALLSYARPDGERVEAP